jgi:hypothetical protein
LLDLIVVAGLLRDLARRVEGEAPLAVVRRGWQFVGSELRRPIAS